MDTAPASRRASPLTWAILLSMLAAAALFTLWPGIDLAVSAFFYCPEIADFVGDQSVLAVAMFRLVPYISTGIILFLAAVFIASFIAPPFRRRDWRIRSGFLLAALILGPGLAIDVAAKDHWGRARPSRIAEFGGAARFTPALLPADQCEKNCSFVSGHASAGFFAVSLGFLGGMAARRRWTLIGLVLGGLAGLGRIAQGGHFLSDVVFAFFITWWSAWLVWRIFRKLGWITAAEEH
ncbi:MAG: phosphatase PAP2 family protein [Azoarcus sp.]|jgi:lipid A 4'-phosphatase|nr:phosphatase PAP2 family protein [Azoarcus sp.]